MITLADAAKRLERAKERQSRYFPVMVDGNCHPEITVRILTVRESITVSKCKKIIRVIQKRFPVKIERLDINMSETDYTGVTPGDYLNVLYGDIGLPQLKNKKAIYLVGRNCLQIWQDGLPMYENDNGEICRDPNALADCLC